MSTDLLPKVDVYSFCDHARQDLAIVISESVRAALVEHGLAKANVLPGALKAVDAATYVGLSRSGFYALLKQDPDLLKRSFTAGRSRLWPTSALDRWMQARQAEAE